MSTIRVLSIKQPWATLIVRGVKRFEARTWPPRWRGRIAIHASSSAIPRTQWNGLISEPEVSEALALVGLNDYADVLALPRSAIVGAATITDARIALDWPATECGDLDCMLSSTWPSDILWRLSGPIEFGPIDGVNGKLNLWSLAEDEASRVLRLDASDHVWAGETHDDSEVVQARVEEEAELEYTRDYLHRRIGVPSELRTLLGTPARLTAADAFKPLLKEVLGGKPLVWDPPWEQQVPVTGEIGSLLVPGRRRAKLRAVCEALAERLCPGQPVPAYLMQFLSA